MDTFSQRITQQDYFLDCWPAYDRLDRIAQRQLGLTPWGPLLDHRVQHVFDAWHYHLYTGQIDALQEAYPRHLIFFESLQELITEDGVLAVDDIGTSWVLMDHDAYRTQRHKQCAFTLRRRSAGGPRTVEPYMPWYRASMPVRDGENPQK